MSMRRFPLLFVAIAASLSVAPLASNGEEMAISKASRITRVIGVSDMQRALTFYRQALGLEVVHESSEWSDLTSGDGNLALQNYHPREPGKYVATMVIFSVDDIDAVIRQVEAAGGQLLQRVDYEGAPVIVAHVADTEGNAIQLAQERP